MQRRTMLTGALLALVTKPAELLKSLAQAEEPTVSTCSMTMEGLDPVTSFAQLSAEHQAFEDQVRRALANATARAVDRAIMDAAARGEIRLTWDEETELGPFAERADLSGSSIHVDLFLD